MCLLSAERVAHVIVVTCRSSSVIFLTPLIVLSLQNMKLKLPDTAPQGIIGAVHSFHWIPAGSFAKCLADSSNPTPKPSLAVQVALIPEGHYWHARNTDVTDLGRASEISVVRLPHHSTNRMQALYVAFMQHYQTHYAQETES
jgi:hypothetical protein